MLMINATKFQLMGFIFKSIHIICLNLKSSLFINLKSYLIVCVTNNICNKN